MDKLKEFDSKFHYSIDSDGHATWLTPTPREMRDWFESKLKEVKKGESWRRGYIQGIKERDAQVVEDLKKMQKFQQRYETFGLSINTYIAIRKEMDELISKYTNKEVT